MEASPSLPNQTCEACSSSVLAFLPLLKLCRESAQRWNEIANHLNAISVHKKATTAYVLMDENEIKIVADRGAKKMTPKEILRSLKYRLHHLRYEEKCKLERARNKVQRKEINLTCPKCRKTYKDLYKFNRHIGNIRKVCCEHCYGVVDVDSFGKHLLTHNIESFRCNICSLHFETEELVLKHKFIHRNGKYMCPECQATFPTMDRLTLHTNFKHATILCVCNEMFRSKACYATHKKCCYHKQKYVCDYCSKEFSNKTVISAHITYFHWQNKSHQCHQCGKRFSNFHSLLEHSYSHDKILDRFTCEFCGQNYSTSGGFRRHMRKKHYKVDPELYKKIRYQCHICEKILISERNLERHLITKHKEY